MDCCVFGRYTNGNAPNWPGQLPPLISASYTATPQTNLGIGAMAALATHYSNALVDAESKLCTLGVSTDFVNVESLLQQVQANPGGYGFLHTTAMDSCSAINCTSQPLSVQNTYVFDNVILTTSAFDQLIANNAAAIINAGQTIPVPVPEPVSAAVASTGLAGLGLVRRRMRA